VQRRLTVVVVRIDISPRLDQQINRGDLVGLSLEAAARIDLVGAQASGRHQRRDALDIGQVGVGAVLQQQLHGYCVSSLRRTQQRSRAHGEHHVRATIRAHRAIGRKELQLRIRIGPGIQQNLNHPGTGGVIQRRLIRAAPVGNGVEINRRP
jgi:hypothetical protein